MGELIVGFFGLLASSVLMIAGVTGSTIRSVATGEPDRGNAKTPTGKPGTIGALTPGGAPTGSLADLAGQSTSGANGVSATPRNAVAPGTAGHTAVLHTAQLHGWNANDWFTLINLESGGNPAAVNPTSKAFGIGQFLGETKDEYAKYGATSTDPLKQLAAMAQYISDRYGNPTAALAFHRAHNYY